jgi:PAS domain S-box-containing protein
MISSPTAELHFGNLLEAIFTTLTDEPSSGAALETLFQLLHERAGLLAMAMEVAAGENARVTPLGDILVLLEIAQTDDPENAPGVIVCPINSPNAPPGEITFVFPPDAMPPLAVIHAATAQITAKLAQETLLQRATDAEDRARQRISELATIYEIGQAMDSEEPERVLQLITDRTAQLMEAQACSLMLFRPLTQSLHVVAQCGLPEEALKHQALLGEGLAGRVAQSEQPLLIVGDVGSELLNGIPLRPEIGSSILVPLKDRDASILGVLSIRRHKPAPEFTTDDLKLFTVFANQAAITITNLRLYTDLRRRVMELNKISTLSQTLLSTLDLDELLQNAANGVCRVIGFERCCIFVRDQGKTAFLPRVRCGYPETVLNAPFRDEGVLGTATREKTPFDFSIQTAPHNDEDTLYRQKRGMARALGTDAFAVVPLLASQNRCVGVIVADNRSRRQPIPADQYSLLIAFSHQAGIAIENAQRHEEMQDKNTNLRRLYSYTDNVLRSIDNGLISTGADGRVVQINRSAQQMLRRDLASVRGQTLTKLITSLNIPGTEQGAILDLIRHVEETGESIEMHQFLIHLPDREPTWLKLALSPLLDHDGDREGVVIVFDDVTQEVRLAAEVEKMRRLADIGQLAAKMAHEVRNALSPIKGAAQMIQAELDNQGGAMEWTEIINSEVDGLRDLTSEMLDFARPARLNLQPIGINGLLTQSVQSLATFLVAHRVIIHWRLEDDLPEIQADIVQLGQVFRNLVMNAAQAMPHGGVLEVGSHYLRNDRILALRFADSGAGIRESDLEKIFRPFFTTKAKGTGLGLPIVQKIVDHHGGTIRVESTLGQGTCFYIYLPLSPPDDVLHTGEIEQPIISDRSHDPFPDR